MFASDVVIIFIIFFGVSFILFGKEKKDKITCYSILSNFYTPLINLILISLLYKIKGLCA
ncbi:hypothetical protein ACQJ6S_01725 [Helicobacter pylori]